MMQGSGGTPVESPSSAAAETLIDALARTARDVPDAAVAVLDRRGAADARTYAEVLRAARARAARYAALGVGEGDVVLVALDTSHDWIDAWFGAIARGALPVAVAPAGAMGTGRAHLDKLDGLLERLDAPVLVTGDGVRDAAREHGIARVADRVRTPAELDDLTPADFVAPTVGANGDAFLQLTSGSTGVPRAVRVRHSAALHNVRAIADALGVLRVAPGEPRPHGVSWLPLHHDMGLVGCLLSCVVHGWSLDLIPPRAFLARPETWLAAIARRDRVISPAPNFAYQACVERDTPSRLGDADLSRWAVGLTGAEMVQPATVAAFTRGHAPLGFDAGTLRPSYGLAEGTLAVTIDRRAAGPRTAPVPGDDTGREVACVGAPVMDTRVRVVDEDGNALPERTVGAVRVAGPGVFAGYRGDAEATARALRDGELVTGDLGFLQDGELYLTGRTKDLLILRGANLMPHELEWCAERVAGGGGLSRAGAFSVDGGAQGEQAVVVVETTATDPSELATLARDVRGAIGREVGLTLHDVALVRRGRIPKTSSGKVQRGELRDRYLDGRLERLDEARPSDAEPETLRSPR